ncbi:hypothetical protein AAG570_009789 [Ranatra chinensis]|uniref:Uncharacterized protein n=1 Tax=Ranatra chinensis TaxID=642074 RepID=A0ABD0YS79_9HEMI
MSYQNKKQEATEIERMDTTPRGDHEANVFKVGVAGLRDGLRKIGRRPGVGRIGGDASLKSIVTGDKTLVSRYTPEKRRPVKWKHTNSLSAKIFSIAKSARKIMAFVLWDRKGSLLIDVLPRTKPGKALTYPNYLGTGLYNGTRVAEFLLLKSTRASALTTIKVGKSASKLWDLQPVIIRSELSGCIVGLYLYMLVVETFTRENIKLRAYVVIGWGE